MSVNLSRILTAFCAAVMLVLSSTCGGGGGGDPPPPSPTNPTTPDEVEYKAAGNGQRTIVLNWQSVAGAASYAIVLNGMTVTTVTAISVTLSPAATNIVDYDIYALDGDGSQLNQDDPIRRQVQAAMDCVGKWSDYDACVNGMQTRAYSISASAQYGGVACEAADGEMESQTCGTPCIGEWQVTRACDPTTGEQTETYTGTPAAGGGAQCVSPAIGETRDVNCPVACAGEWRNKPEAACKPGNLQPQIYTETQAALHGGAACASPAIDDERDLAGGCVYTPPPIDCVGAWSDSGQCLPSGKQREEFTVSQPARNKGAACEAADGDTRDIKDCAFDCVGGWSEYGQCADGMQTRTYSITDEAQNFGAVCPQNSGDTETRNCGTACEGDFGEWDACQSDGMQTRTYAITTPAADGGAQCPHSEGHAEERSCAFDCVGDYGPFGECQPDGMQTAEYVVSTPAAGGGQCPLQGATQRQSCDYDCVGAWSEYGQCADGEQTRTYSITAEAQNSGAACAAADGKTESRACGTACVGDFGDYGECRPDGTQTRTYAISQNAVGGGLECPHPNGHAESQSCAFDCVGAWSEYGQCTDGAQTRTYSVTAEAQNNGAACAADEGKTESRACGTACIGEWRAGACDPTTGRQTETYTATQAAADGGAQCVSPAIGETRDVNCPVACAGEWRNKPGAACKPGNLQPQIYTETQAALHGGAACASPAIDDERDLAGGCVYTPPPVACVGEWSDSGQCLPSGKQREEFTVSQAAQNGGTCEAANGDTRDIKDCAFDCVGEWSEYGNCVGGKQTRTYSISAGAQNFGAECPQNNGETQTRDCGTADCVGAWSAWGECLTDGTETRIYAIATPADGGAQCSQNNGDTETRPCAFDCIGAWSRIGQCTPSGKQREVFSVRWPAQNGGACEAANGATREIENCSDCIGEWSDYGACENGVQTRAYSITAPALNNGAACEFINGGMQSRVCGTACVGAWSEWSECDEDGFDHRQTRTYSITTPAQNNGAACGFTNGASETRICASRFPVHCELTLQKHGVCQPGTSLLPEGVQEMIVVHTQPAVNGGRPCHLAEGEIFQHRCTYIPPEPEPCAGTWTAVGSSCSASCGRGTITEVFEVTIPGDDCPASDGDTRLAYCDSGAICPQAAKDPIIAVADDGAHPEVFVHAASDGETGGYFVNQEVENNLRAADAADAAADALEGEFYGSIAADRTAGSNAWAKPVTTPFPVAVLPITVPDFDGATSVVDGCASIPRLLFYQNGVDSAADCAADELYLRLVVSESGKYAVDFNSLSSRADYLLGAIFALRDDARLLSRRAAVADSPAGENAASVVSAFAKFREYNAWAASAGEEKLRIFSNSFSVSRLAYSVDGVCNSGLAPPAEGVLCLGQAESIPAEIEELSRLMNDDASRDALVIFAAGESDSPTSFPQMEAMLPVLGSPGTVTVSRCVTETGLSCGNYEDVALNQVWTFLGESKPSYAALKNRFIAAVAATFRVHAVPDDFDSWEDNAEAEKYATFDSTGSKCGIAREWCMAALGEKVPPADVRWSIAPEQSGGMPATVSVFYGEQSGGADFSGTQSVAIIAPGERLGGTAMAASRIAAAAAGVMRNSAMTDGAAVQAVLFKTAYKCRDSVNKPAARPFAPDATLADLLRPSCNGIALNSNVVGQGILNYDGALEEATSIRVGGANGQVAGGLADAAFNAPSYFGDGVARRLAKIDLDLIGASGNRYRHRPLDGAFRSASFAFDDADRVFAFGKTRVGSPMTTINGAQLFAHSETPFGLGEEQGGVSGFSYQSPLASGVFNFSYDDNILPSRFNAQTTLLPEANISPYLDFARKGMELSFQSGGFFAGGGGVFSFAAAQGGRADNYGNEAEALIGVASYRKKIADFNFDLSLGALREQDRLLGAKTGGAFATDGALTKFAGLRAEWTLDSFIPSGAPRRRSDDDRREKEINSAADNLTFFAALWRGETTAQPAPGAIFQHRLDIDSESYAMGGTKQRLFRRDDEFTFAVLHPLRVHRAEARLALSLDRNGETQKKNIDLAARAREYDFSIAYRRTFGDDGRFTIGVLYRLNPAHRDDAKAESVAAFSLGAEW